MFKHSFYHTKVFNTYMKYLLKNYYLRKILDKNREFKKDLLQEVALAVLENRPKNELLAEIKRKYFTTLYITEDGDRVVYSPTREYIPKGCCSLRQLNLYLPISFKNIRDKKEIFEFIIENDYKIRIPNSKNIKYTTVPVKVSLPTYFKLLSEYKNSNERSLSSFFRKKYLILTK